MAKEKMADATSMPKGDRVIVREGAEFPPTADTDADPWMELVHGSDYIPPNAKPTQANAAVEEEEQPQKNRIAVLVVGNKVAPVFAPIEGFEHLFTDEAIGADSSQATTADRVAELSMTQNEEENAASKTPKQSRGVKRYRANARSGPSTRRNRAPADEHGDQEFEARSSTMQSLYIADIDALKAFYAVRFKELTMKPLRGIVTEWVKMLCPKRLNEYGPYHNKPPADMPDKKHPVWWPEDIPYNEPSHLQLQYLIPLAVDIMQMHRNTDEESGKRDGFWVKKLKKCALYSVTMTPTDTFSSAKYPAYNAAMKKRATDVILASLFDIAQSHEEYMTRHQLFDGCDNKDPGYGQHVSWQRAAKPSLTVTKRRRIVSKNDIYSRGAKPDDEESGYDTEVDDLPVTASSSFSSFQSEEDARVVMDASPAHTPRHPISIGLRNAGAGFAHSQSQVMPENSIVTPRFGFDESLRRLHLGDQADVDMKAEGGFATSPFSANVPNYNPSSFQASNAPMPVPTPYGFIPGSVDAPGPGFFPPQHVQSPMTHDPQYLLTLMAQSDNRPPPKPNGSQVYKREPSALMSAPSGRSYRTARFVPGAPPPNFQN